MNISLPEVWNRELRHELQQPYFGDLIAKVEREYTAHTVFPPADSVMAAFEACDFSDVKVVILGQDPYHGAGEAHGLSFSVQPGVKMPPSLRNILKEVSADTGAPLPSDGCLSRWAHQGVLLLNVVLTVRENQAGSHASLGWQRFTDAVISCLSNRREHLVFMLWGNYAQRKAELIDHTRHLVLSSVHPSPLSASRGFFGNHHFTKANDYLTLHGKTPVIW